MSFFACSRGLQWFATEGLDDSSEYSQLSWSLCPALPLNSLRILLLRLLPYFVCWGLYSGGKAVPSPKKNSSM